jgi:hypothetical protein
MEAADEETCTLGLLLLTAFYVSAIFILNCLLALGVLIAVFSQTFLYIAPPIFQDCDVIYLVGP